MVPAGMIFLRYKTRPVVFVISANVLIFFTGHTGNGGKQQLGDRHFGAENNGNRIEIGEFERDMQVMPRVDKSRGIVDNKSNTGKRTFSGKLDKVFFRAEIIGGKP